MSDAVVWQIGAVNGPIQLTQSGMYSAASVLDQAGFVVLGEQGYQQVSPCGSGPDCYVYGPYDTITTFRADLNFSGLQMTSEAQSFFSSAWGLTLDGQAALARVNMASPSAGWGQLNAEAFFRTSTYGAYPRSLLPNVSIPEPSSYALMGVGLFAVGACAVRKRKHPLEAVKH